MLYLHQDLKEKAKTELYKLIAIDESSLYAARARNELIAVLLKSKEVEEAKHLVEKALDLNDGDSTALLNRARIALVQGDSNQAVADLRNGLGYKPDSFESLRLLEEGLDP